jgi:hypothetical protein
LTRICTTTAINPPFGSLTIGQHPNVTDSNKSKGAKSKGAKTVTTSAPVQEKPQNITTKQELVEAFAHHLRT